MQLCALLKIPSRRILKKMLTHREMLEWQELWSCDPWGQDRADLRAGQIASAVLAPWSKRKPPSPIAFMPYVEKGPPKPASDEKMKAVFRSKLKAFNANHEKKDD
jgi:hypothetical protein